MTEIEPPKTTSHNPERGKVERGAPSYSGKPTIIRNESAVAAVFRVDLDSPGYAEFTVQPGGEFYVYSESPVKVYVQDAIPAGVRGLVNPDDIA